MSDVRQILRGISGTVACLGLLANCESASTTVATNPESRLRLSPQELTPIAGCQQSSNDASDMSGYVATLIDVTNPDKPKTILSGPPTTCTSSITFAVSADRGDLKVGNSYVAIVDGYSATNLSAVKRDQRAVESSGSATAPSWQWLCSFGALPEDTLSTLLDVLQTIPRQPTHVPNADASTAPDADVSSSSDDAAALDASSDATTELSDAQTEAGLADAAQSTSVVDASPLDASPVDAATDASTQSGADAARSGASTVETTGDLVPLDSGLLGLNLRDGASSVDAGVATQPAEPTTMSDAASTEEVAASALEFVLEIAKDPTTPGPATLVQSRLGTLRGCVALP